MLNIPQNEKNIIDEIRRYDGPGDCIPKCEMRPVEDFLFYWNEGKMEYLYKLFGHKLRLSKTITISADSTSLIERLQADSTIADFRDQYFRALRETGDPDFYRLRYSFMDLVSYTCLAHNKYIFENFKVDDIELKYGMKVMKPLKKVCERLGLGDEFEKFRLAHSRILNTKEHHGTLSLSIHPIDYMTMSDNENGWTSCMSWRENGEYHLGTLEMMTSPYIIVASLDSKSAQMLYESGTWPSKKWRTLIVVHPHIITAIKDYPYQSDELETAALQWVRELAQENLGWELDPTIHQHKRGKILDIESPYTYYFRTNAMYNDFNCRDYHNCLLPKEPPHIADCHVNINYSGPTICVWCGNLIENYDEFGTDCLLCPSCNATKFNYCDYCNERVHPSEEMYTVDGLELCYCCFDENAITLSWDGSTHLIDNCCNIHIVPIIRSNWEALDKNAQQRLVYNNPKTVRIGIHNSMLYSAIEDTLNAAEYFTNWSNWDWDNDDRIVCLDEITEEGKNFSYEADLNYTRNYWESREDWLQRIFGGE